MNCHLNICLVKETKRVWNCLFMHFFLSDISASSSLPLLKEEIPLGSPWERLVRFRLTAMASVCLIALSMFGARVIVCARACMCDMCHHVRMVVTSPLTAHEEHSSNVHCHCPHHDDRSRGWGSRNLSKMAALCDPQVGILHVTICCHL